MSSFVRCRALHNEIEHQSPREHDDKCTDGSGQGFAVPLWLNFTHGIQLGQDGVESHEVDGNGENGGDDGPQGDGLSPKQQNHRQKGQKNQLAVGHPVYQILNKQTIRLPILGRIPLFEGIHAVAVFEIGLEVQNDNVGQFHDKKNRNGYFQNDKHGCSAPVSGFGERNDSFNMGGAGEQIYGQTLSGDSRK